MNGGPARAKRLWSLYVIRVEGGALYTGIALDVQRRFEVHRYGGRMAAKCLRGRRPGHIAFSKVIGTRSLALKVEYWFKRLPKARKEAVINAGDVCYDRETGRITS
jgi:putative endonuclease